MSELDYNEINEINNSNAIEDGDINESMDDEHDNEENYHEQNREEILWKIYKDKPNSRYGKYKSSSIENRKKNRSSTNKFECPRTKKIVQNVLGEHIQLSNEVLIVLAAIAKIYAGELVEEAKLILVDKEGLKDKYPPIKPKYLREARRRMIQRKILTEIKKNYLFKKK